MILFSLKGYATQMFTEEDLEAEALLVKDGDQEPVIMNRLQAQLYALASDPATFLSDPDPDDQASFFFKINKKKINK